MSITLISPNSPPGSGADSIASDEIVSSDEEYNDHRDLLDRENPVFWGKSSGLRLVRFAMDTRSTVTGKRPSRRVRSLKVRDEFWEIQDVSPSRQARIHL
jgi:hypothetical protein